MPLKALKKSFILLLISYGWVCRSYSFNEFSLDHAMCEISFRKECSLASRVIYKNINSCSSYIVIIL